jgi:hypothetical protein
MSLWIDGLTVAGTFLLTLGTSNQAWSAMVEFKDLVQTLRKTEREVTNDELAAMFAPLLYVVGLGYIVAEAQHGAQPTVRQLIQKAVFGTIGTLIQEMVPAVPLRGDVVGGLYLGMFRWRTALGRIREKGDDDAVKLGEFYRQARVWGMLTVGSELILAAAVISLIHDA